MLHHDRNYVAAVEAERLRAATWRRSSAAADPARALAAAAAGDAQAWDELRASYDSRVRRVARRFSLVREDVDDVSQATWLRLFRQIGSIRDPNALGAWLATTARRESLRLLEARRNGLPTEHGELPDTPAPIAPAPVFEDERRAALAAAINRLPGRQAALMRMLIADPEPSYTEIARTLDMPVGSIGPTRARSLARLRRDRELIAALA